MMPAVGHFPRADTHAPDFVDALRNDGGRQFVFGNGFFGGLRHFGIENRPELSRGRVEARLDSFEDAECHCGTQRDFRDATSHPYFPISILITETIPAGRV